MTRIAGPLVALLLAVSAFGTPSWYTYEGDTYPESEGWTRHVYGDPAQRALVDGALTIDSLQSTHTADSYDRQFSGGLNPSPGEEFVVQWRVRLEQVIGNYDLSLGFFSDDTWGVAFTIGSGAIRSMYEEGQPAAAIAPLVYHSYEFRSPDMRQYTLRIDGQPALCGTFADYVFDGSRITWGDGAQGAASLSEWDFMRFGVVPTHPCKGAMRFSPSRTFDSFRVMPEPHSVLSCAVLAFVALGRNVRAARARGVAVRGGPARRQLARHLEQGENV